MILGELHLYTCTNGVIPFQSLTSLIAPVLGDGNLLLRTRLSCGALGDEVDAAARLNGDGRSRGLVCNSALRFLRGDLTRLQTGRRHLRRGLSFDRNLHLIRLAGRGDERDGFEELRS